MRPTEELPPAADSSVGKPSLLVSLVGWEEASLRWQSPSWEVEGVLGAREAGVGSSLLDQSGCWLGGRGACRDLAGLWEGLWQRWWQPEADCETETQRCPPAQAGGRERSHGTAATKVAASPGGALEGERRGMRPCLFKKYVFIDFQGERKEEGEGRAR